MISHNVLANVQKLSAEFINNKPFKHVEIRDFLEESVLSDIIRDFPKFDNSATNEFGAPSKKHVVTDLSRISKSYKKFYDYISSKKFLDIISEITKIDNLIFDSTMFGGGTHNNLHGQKLDPHVDFNYDNFGNHRRLNLLIYLNDGWQESWGGCLELHSNPRNPENNKIKTIYPTLNNCAIFETNEYSWHGFREIRLPQSALKKDVSRKCISIYLYTKTRPKEEIFGAHGTYYVQYPAQQLKINQIITPQIHNYIKNHIDERDQWIQRYQKSDLQLRTELKHLEKYKIKQIGSFEIESIEGQLNGNWLAESAIIKIKIYKNIHGLRLTFYLPEKYLHFSNKNNVFINGELVGCNVQTQETQTLDFKQALLQDKEYELKINNENIIKIKEREIYGCLLVSITEL